MAFRIEIAREFSFCPGVDRAFRITGKTLYGRPGRVYSAGPLIHNPEVVERLGMLGLQVLDPDSATLPELDGAPVIIRSHGIDTATESRLAGAGALLVDATCPTVKRAQDAASELALQGRQVLVLGSSSHPEVKSIVGRAGEEVAVAENIEEARAWARARAAGGRKVGIVCQTTVPRRFLEDVVIALEPVALDVEVRDTICEAVERRHSEAVSLAGACDTIIVVGGHNSSNTAHLASICAQAGVPAYHVESRNEILPEWVAGAGVVGVTGGASTPDWQVEEAVVRLIEFGGKTA